MGDSVRVSANQRLDKPDFDAIQSLVYRGVREAIGGMLGGSAGALTPVVWSKSNANGVYLLSFEKMVVAWSKAVETRVEDRGFDPAVTVDVGYESRIIPFDPDEIGHQNHPLDYTDARTAEQDNPGTKPYIWVRPVVVPADTDVRRFWSVAIGDETAAATATRNFVRLQFAINETTPVQGIGDKWSAIARVMTWSGDDITRINAISVWDDPDIAGMLQDPGDPEDFNTDSASMAHPLQRMQEGSQARADGSEDDWQQGTRRTLGLPQALQWVYSRLQRHISGGTEDPANTRIDPWWGVPQISLNGAYADLAAKQTDLDRTTLHETIFSGVLTYYPAGTYDSPYDGAGWYLRDGWGAAEVLSGTRSGNTNPWAGCALRLKDTLVAKYGEWYVSSVNVTPVGSSSHTVQLRPFMHTLGALFDDPAVRAPGALYTISALAAQGYGDLLDVGEYGVYLETSVLEVSAGPVLTQTSPAVESDLSTGVSFCVTVNVSRYNGLENEA